MRFRADIEGLRAIAVIPVVLFHCGVPHFDGGFVGVDVFFVISGFLITKVILDDLNAGVFSVLNFYDRRVRRILPAFFFVMAASFGWALLRQLPSELVSTSKSAFFAGIFASNIWFWHASLDYFNSTTKESIFLHTWSLSVEEQFYLVFPLLVSVMARISPNGRLARSVVPFACLFSFLASVSIVQYAPNDAFYLPMYRAWELLVGAALAFGVVSVPQTLLRTELCTLLGLALILGSVFFFNEGILFPGLAASIPVLGSAMVIVGGADAAGRISNGLLGNKCLRFIGNLSYSLYLWHWPVIVIVNRELGIAEPWIRSVLAIFMSVLLSNFSVHYIEAPFRRTRKGRASNRTVAMALVVIVFSSVLMLSVIWKQGLPNRFEATVLNMSRGAYDSSPIRDECHAHDVKERQIADSCVLGSPSVLPSVAVWGDSHGVELATALAESFSTAGKSLMLITHSACPPIFEVGRVSDECLSHNRNVSTFLAQAEGIKSVVLVSRFPGHFEADRRSAFKEGYENAVRRMRTAGKRVAVVYPIPEFTESVPESNARRIAEKRELLQLPVQLYMKNNRESRAFLDSLVAKYKLYILDPLELICSDEHCPSELDGAALYFDRHHLSMTGARLLVSQIADSVQKNLYEPAVLEDYERRVRVH